MHNFFFFFFCAHAHLYPFCARNRKHKISQVLQYISRVIIHTIFHLDVPKSQTEWQLRMEKIQVRRL